VGITADMAEFVLEETGYKSEAKVLGRVRATLPLGHCEIVKV